MNSKILYDKTGSFYPESDAEFIHSNALVDGSNVKKDLQTLHAQIGSLTGADTVNGALSVEVKYAVSSSADPSFVNTNANWQNTVQAPTVEAPYSWMKLQFYWTVGEATAPLTPILCTIATKGVETQTMYTSLSSLEGTEGLTGPSDFSISRDGLADQSVSNVIWTYFFPGIGPQNIYGLCATRVIEPGASVPIGPWQIRLMAQYPTIQN